MISNPLVSIIIAVKDRINLLRITLDNILNQEYQNLEIILVDDNSTERIESLLTEFEDFRIKYFKSLSIGPGAARNLGLIKSSGDFIKFFDSDDLMTKNLIGSQVKEINISNADVVYSPYVKVSYVEGKINAEDEIMHYLPWKEDLHRLMLKSFFIPIPSFIFKREFLIGHVNWPERYISYEDWSFLWDISVLNPAVSHTNDGCFFYIIHGNQSTESRISNTQRIKDFNELVVSKWIDKYSERLSFNSIYLISASLGNHWANISMNNKAKISKNLFRIIFIKLCSITFRLSKKVQLIISKKQWSYEYGTSKSNKIFFSYQKKLK